MSGGAVEIGGAVSGQEANPETHVLAVSTGVGVATAISVGGDKVSSLAKEKLLVKDKDKVKK